MALLKRGRSDPGVGAETEVFPDCKATKRRKVIQKKWGRWPRQLIVEFLNLI
jgi:hypothetical protein